MRRTVPPSTEIQQQIDKLLAEGVAATDAEGALSQLARLGAQLIIQRAVEEEFDAFLLERARVISGRLPFAEAEYRNLWRTERSVSQREGQGRRVRAPGLQEGCFVGV